MDIPIDSVGCNAQGSVTPSVPEQPGAAVQHSMPEASWQVVGKRSNPAAHAVSRKDTSSPYTPLGRNQFRLLRLTGRIGGRICGELITANMASTSIFWRTKRYTCLSYMWGPEVAPKSENQINLNGQPFFVSPNLMSFLTCYVADKFVSPDAAANDDYLWVDETSLDIYLWIDQICIDQANVLEKNDQVSRMDEIYRNAQGGAIVWLGDPQAMSYLGESLETVAWSKITDLVDRMTTLSEAVFGSKNAHSVCEEQMSSEDFGALDRIVSNMVDNPYWTRMWIVQEVFLCPSLVLMYGPRIFPNATIYTIGSFDYYRNPGFTPSRVYELWTDKRRFDLQKGMHLLEALKWVEGECSNLHDKIFALLGLVAMNERKLISINYASNTGHLFQDVLRASIITYMLSLSDSHQTQTILARLEIDLGLPHDLMPLGRERRDNGGRLDFMYIHYMTSQIKRPYKIVDFGRLSLVQLVQFIYDETKPEHEWQARHDEDRTRLREWLDMKEAAEVEELDRYVEDLKRPAMSRVEIDDFVVVSEEQ